MSQRVTFNHQRLRQFRLELGLTQEAAATLMQVTTRTWRRYETGQVNAGAAGFEVNARPSRVEFLHRLCAEFGGALDDWLTRSARAEIREGAQRHHVTHPLQRAAGFAGRQAERAQITRWSSGAGSRVLAVVGVGGAGKTALVEQALQGLLAQEAPSIFVWSFYAEPRLERALIAARQWLGLPEGAGLEALVAGGAQARPQRIWVLDGLEVAQSHGADGYAMGELVHPELRRWLKSMAGGEGRDRALITSRLAPVDLTPWAPEGFEVLPLTPLSSEEAAEVLEAYGVSPSRAEQAQLAELGGHALTVAMVGACARQMGAAHLALEGLEQDLERLSEDEALAARLYRLLSAYVDQLGPVEREVLGWLSLMPRGADADIVSRMGRTLQPEGAQRSEQGVRRALQRLLRADLIYPVGEAVYSAHPFVRASARQWMEAPTASVHEAIAQGLEDRLIGQPMRWPEGAALDDYEALVEHTLKAGQPWQAWSLYQRALGGFSHLGLRLGEMSRGLRLLSGFLSGPELGWPEGLELGDAAALLYDLGLYQGAMGDLPQAARVYAHQAELLMGQPDHRLHRVNVMVTRRTQAYTARLRGLAREALTLLADSRRLAIELQAPRHLRLSWALEGAIRADLGEIDVSEICFARAERESDEPPAARHGLWRAEALMQQGRWLEAEALTLRNRSVCSDRAWPGHVAHCDVVLAECLLVQGRPARAWQRLAEAEAWVRHSQEMEMALRCRRVRAMAQRSSGQPEAALETLTQAVELAEEGDFMSASQQMRALIAEVSLD